MDPEDPTVIAENELLGAAAAIEAAAKKLEQLNAMRDQDEVSVGIIFLSFLPLSLLVSPCPPPSISLSTCLPLCLCL